MEHATLASHPSHTLPTILIPASHLQGSKDNMSIVLVTFPSAPKPNAEAQRADRELDATLRQRLTGCYHSLLHACSHKHRDRQRTDNHIDRQNDCRNESGDARA